jgi:cyclophilin family peptidyl-prolyl cis-trans isomerase
MVLHRYCSLLLAAVLAILAAGCGSREGSSPGVTASIGGNTSESSGGAPKSGKASTQRDNRHPEVVMRTTFGDITFRLDAERAPLTVENFLSYVESGQYDGTVFHQVHPDFIVLGGGYDAEGNERPAYTAIRNEAHNGLKNTRGTIAMARNPEVIDSATRQFFLNVADNPGLDFQGSENDEYGYCVFGQVIAGQDVVDRIGKAPVRDGAVFESMPLEPIVIRSIERIK